MQNSLPGTHLLARPDGWFDAGTVVVVVVNCGACGVIASGLRRGRPDEELCAWDEFQRID